MSKASVLLGIVTVALAGTCVYFYQQLQAERERVETLLARLSHAETVPRVTHSDAEPARGASPARSMTAGSDRATSPARPANAPSAGQRAAMPMRFARMRERTQQMLQNPEYRAAMRAQHKVSLQQMYPDAGRALGLSPEEIDQFFELLAEQQVRAMESPPPMMFDVERPPDEQAMEDWRRRMAEEEQRRNREIAELLGEAKLEEWQGYQQSLGARMQVRQLRDVLNASGLPLRDDQYEPLVTAIAQEYQRSDERTRNATPMLGPGGLGVPPPQQVVAFDRRRPPDPADQVAMLEQNIEQMTQLNQRLKDAASSHLSSEQLERFGQLLDQRVEMARANLTLVRAQASEPAGEGDGVNVVTGSGIGIAISAD